MRPVVVGCFVVAQLLGAGAGAGTTTMQLDVMPVRTVRPIDSWHLRAWITRDDRHRTLRVEARSEVFDRATDLPLNGNAAPRVHDIWWAGHVPCGDYIVVASVFGPSGQVLEQTRRRAEICVVSTTGP